MARMTMTDTFLSFFSFLPRTTSSFFWVPFIKQASKQASKKPGRDHGYVIAFRFWVFYLLRGK